MRISDVKLFFDFLEEIACFSVRIDRQGVFAPTNQSKAAIDMSVKTASKLVSRAMRAAIKETISPANQGAKTSSEKRPLAEVGKVNRQFGHELHQRLQAYTGSVDEFGCPGNTVDSWRLQFSGREHGLKAANRATVDRRRGR
jgi:hypothetical protein